MRGCQQRPRRRLRAQRFVTNGGIWTGGSRGKRLVNPWWTCCLILSIRDGLLQVQIRWVSEIGLDWKLFAAERSPDHLHCMTSTIRCVLSLLLPTLAIGAQPRLGLCAMVGGLAILTALALPHVGG